MKSSQLGATLTEFITIGPLIFFLGMNGLQYTLMYNAKTNLTYASYEAARAGAIENASPQQIEMGLLKGFLPYLSANKGIGGGKLDNAKVFALAFNDFNSPILQKTLGTKQKVIPNKLTDMENLKSKPGASSGVNISEANVLKLRITYGYKPTIPLVGGFFAKAFDFLSGPKDAFSAMLFASNRIPIVVDVSSQMLSPAIQNTLKVASNNPGTGTGTVGDNHQLPDLSTVKLPGKYEGMSREEIIEDIRANGGINTDSNTSNKDWLKLLIALGIITLGASQMDDIDDAFDANGNIVDSDLVSDFQNQNTCSP